MKFIYSIFVSLLIISTAHAQAPQGIPYQAAARTSSGAVLASTPITVRFTIRDSIATGAIKYRETHSVTTTDQGMFSVNIGQGTPVSGTFATINWATNAKYMQVEMDPAGGSSYSDIGTQQMMSVPYALSTGSVKFSVSETGDTLYSGEGKFVIIPGISAANCTVLAGIITGADTVAQSSTTMLSNATSGGLWSSSNSAIATIGSSGLVSGIGIGTTTISYTVTNACGTATATKTVTVTPFSFVIGASYRGGILAYILQPTDSGYVAGQIKGLIAAPSNIGSPTYWGCSGTLIGGTSTILGAGSANTANVIAGCTVPGTPARLCYDLVLGGYDDWYLPSSDELKILQTNCIAIGFTDFGNYWSSSEFTSTIVMRVNFLLGSVDFAIKNTANKVRAIRSFNCPETPANITGSAAVCIGTSNTLGNATSGGVWSSSNPSIATVNSSSGVVTGVAVGTVTISYTVTESCGSASITQVVTVNQLPGNGSISGSATLATGSTILLTNPVAGGTWSSSNTSIATIGTGGIVSGIAAGTTIISYAVNNFCGTATPTLAVTVALPSLSVGMSYGGGKIAYLLQSGDPGYVAGQLKGLIAAPSDQGTSIRWNCYASNVAGTSTAIGTGAANTAIISPTCSINSGARLCDNLVLGSYSDWYLPSRDELSKLYLNRVAIGGFTTGRYLSSSQIDNFYVWITNFSSGANESFLKNSIGYVRAVRSFSCPETPNSISGIDTLVAGNSTTLSSTTSGGAWASSNTAIASVNTTGLVTGIAAGTATISYTISNACGSASVTKTVTVSAAVVAPSITVGSSYGGGIVAYLLQPGDFGYVPGETHGLIAAPYDQSAGITWGCNDAYAGSTNIGGGAGNTYYISFMCGPGTAARLCDDLVLGGYSDWYLPNKLELSKLYKNRIAIGGFSGWGYWCSNEFNYTNAWRILFWGGYDDYYSKVYGSYAVRAVRLF